MSREFYVIGVAVTTFSAGVGRHRAKHLAVLRFAQIDQRFDEVDQRFDALRAEMLGHFDEVYRRLERLGAL